MCIRGRAGVLFLAYGNLNWDATGEMNRRLKEEMHKTNNQGHMRGGSRQSGWSRQTNSPYCLGLGHAGLFA